MAHVIACDIDLRRAHAWSNLRGRVAYQEPNPYHFMDTVAAEFPDVVLVEVASARDYDDGLANPGARINKRRWMLWNIHAVTLIGAKFGDKVKVSPSSVWTRGHPEKVRHAAANCKATNHDLRETEAMIAFHAIRPGDWIPLSQYLANL